MVYMVAPLYADAGSRPEFSNADVSPYTFCVTIKRAWGSRMALTWWMADPFWTRMLWPRPRSFPSLDTRAAPICGSMFLDFDYRYGHGLVCMSYWNSTFFVSSFGLLDCDGKSFLVVHRE